MRKNHNCHVNVLILVMTFIILIILIEVSTRVYIKANFGKDSFFYANQTQGKLLNYFRPNSEVLVSGNKYTLNNEGFRDNAFTEKKAENATRIAILGDSFTFGDGLEDTADTYAKQLEKLLNREKEKKYEVMNFGMPGANSMDLLWIFQNKIMKYEPEIVIYGFFINDIEYLDYNTNINYCIPLGHSDWYSYDFFRIRASNIISRVRGIDTEKSSLYFKDTLKPGYYGFGCFRRIVQMMHEDSVKKNIKFLVFYVPYNKETYLEEEIYDALMELGIDAVPNVSKTFSDYSRQINLTDKMIWVSAENRHYSKKSNRVLADILHQFLIERGYTR